MCHRDLSRDILVAAIDTSNINAKITAQRNVVIEKGFIYLRYSYLRKWGVKTIGPI